MLGFYETQQRKNLGNNQKKEQWLEHQPYQEIDFLNMIKNL